MLQLIRQSMTTLLVVFVSCIGSAWSADTEKTAWRISGELEEACSCDAACPCWWDSKPTR